MITEKIITKTKEYLKIPAACGLEGPFLDYLLEDFAKLGCETKREEKLLLVSKGDVNKNTVCCHIDREGFVVNEEGEIEYSIFYLRRKYGKEVTGVKAKFDKIGQDFTGSTVFLYNDDGVILSEGKIRSYNFLVNEEKLVFSVEGLGEVKPGQALFFGDNLTVSDENIGGQTDNAISVATLYQIMADGFEGTMIFTAEEECGKSGEYIADYFYKQNLLPQDLIIVDITPYHDTTAVDCGLVVLRNRDARGDFNVELVNVVRQICFDAELAFEMKDEHILKVGVPEPYRNIGFTELGQIIKYTDGKMNGASVQIPTVHKKMHDEMTNYKSLYNYYYILKKITDK